VAVLPPASQRLMVQIFMLEKTTPPELKFCLSTFFQALNKKNQIRRKVKGLYLYLYINVCDTE
jgi:hypothetical protein